MTTMTMTLVVNNVINLEQASHTTMAKKLRCKREERLMNNLHIFLIPGGGDEETPLISDSSRTKESAWTTVKRFFPNAKATLPWHWGDLGD